MSDNQYVTEVQAAALAGVVHETVNNWGTSGKITVVEDRETLARFNANKPGRPCSRLYLRDEILEMKDKRGVTEPPNNLDLWWTVKEIAAETQKSVRTVYRALKSHEVETWRDTSGKIYVEHVGALALLDELDPISESE